MRKKIQRYLSGEREGFSLIELIIVIAIMAILVGVVALVVLPYLESARESSDRSALEEVTSAFISAVSLNDDIRNNSNIDGVKYDEVSGLEKAINTYLEGTISDAEAGLASSACAGCHFQFTYDMDEGAISVSIVDEGGEVAVDSNDSEYTAGATADSEEE